MGKSIHNGTGSATKSGFWPKTPVLGQESHNYICSINLSWNLGKPANFMMSRKNKCVPGAGNIATVELQGFRTGLFGIYIEFDIQFISTPSLLSANGGTGLVCRSANAGPADRTTMQSEAGSLCRDCHESTRCNMVGPRVFI